MDEWLEAPSARCLSVHLKKHLVRRPESDSRVGFRQVTTVVSACILMNQRGGKQTPANKQKGGFLLSELRVSNRVKAAMQSTQTTIRTTLSQPGYVKHPLANVYTAHLVIAAP